MTSRKDKEEADKELDRELADSFPASDPPQVTRFRAGSDTTSAEDVDAEATAEPPLPPASGSKQ